MKKITPSELKDWIASGKTFVIIDVREAWERALHDIGGMHIPLGDVLQRKGDIPVDVSTIVYCEHGIRSSVIIQKLQAEGFHNLYNLTGGIAGWHASGN